MKTGFKLLISAKTGIGSGRDAAASNKARPAVREPVKPTAFANGCLHQRHADGFSKAVQH